MLVEENLIPILSLALFFALSVSFSVLINYLIVRFARNLGMRSTEDANLVRWGSTSKPSLGGFSFYILFLLSIAIWGVVPGLDGELGSELVGLLAACSLAFLIGLADDTYNTNPLVKFLGQFTCANILIVTGFSIQVTGFAEVNYIFTMLWVIGLMNSINMLDNMDAITTSVSISIVIGVLTIIALNTEVGLFYEIIMLGVLGALIGFLRYNWNPSVMYMGDTGSQFLGVFLAGISILFVWNFRDPAGGEIQLQQFAIPLLLFIVPLIDTTTVVIRRLSRKQSPFVGGKDHITHNLAYLGLSDRKVALTLLGISLVSVVLSGIIFTQLSDWRFEYTIAVVVYGLGLFLFMQVLYNKAQSKMKEDKA